MSAAEQIQEAKATVQHAGGDGRPVESATLGKLAEALAKAQLAIEPASKDNLNPHFKSRYADLASIREVIRRPLAENGLAYFQRTSSRPGGVLVETTLVHTSGEFIRDSCWLPVAQATPQAYGSAITYARRYSLAALVGVVADEDDDGNAASGTPAPRPATQSQTERVKEQLKKAQAQREPGEDAPEPPPSDTPPQPPDMEIKFGKSKGKMASELTDKELLWYLQAARDNYMDPAKEKFKAQALRDGGILKAIADFRGLDVQ